MARMKSEMVRGKLPDSRGTGESIKESLLTAGTPKKMTCPRVSKPLLPARPIICRYCNGSKKTLSPAKMTDLQGMLMPYARVPAFSAQGFSSSVTRKYRTKQDACLNVLHSVSSPLWPARYGLQGPNGVLEECLKMSLAISEGSQRWKSHKLLSATDLGAECMSAQWPAR